MNKTKYFTLFSFYAEGCQIQLRTRLNPNGTFVTKGGFNQHLHPGYKQNAKKRGLGFKPISFWHKNCDFHHIDRERVVAVPFWIHNNIPHRISDGSAFRLEGILG